jgi:RND family efflux transporter MFP subunit
MSDRLLTITRASLKWILLLGVAGFAVYVLHLKPTSVSTVRPARADLVQEILGTGTLEAKTRVRISSRVQGRIAGVHAEQNDIVTSGQPLVRIEATDREAELGQALASLETAKATRDRLETERTRALVTKDQKFRDLERIRDLRDSDAVSLSQLEQTDEQYRIAMAEVARSEAALVEARRVIEEAEQRVILQEARLAETRIVAPFDGLVIRRNVDPGDFCVPGTTMLDIVSTDTLWVSAWVDESAVNQLHVGQPARVVFRASADQSIAGVVRRWNREVDRETRQFLVDVELIERPGEWAIGQRAEVYIAAASSEQTITLPASVVTWRDGAAGAYLLRAGRALWREVEVGIRTPDQLQILSGLDEKDKVIIPRAQLSLSEGKRVSDESRTP